MGSEWLWRRGERNQSTQLFIWAMIFAVEHLPGRFVGMTSSLPFVREICDYLWLCCGEGGKVGRLEAQKIRGDAYDDDVGRRVLRTLTLAQNPPLSFSTRTTL